MNDETYTSTTTGMRHRVFPDEATWARMLEEAKKDGPHWESPVREDNK